MAIAFSTFVGSLGSSGSSDFGTLTSGVVVFGISSNSSIIGLTVNGISGTQRVHDTANESGPVVDLWTVPVGTMSGTVAWSISGGSGISATAVSYIGVDQTTPVNASNQGNEHNVSNTVSVASTPSLANCWAVAFATKNGACATDSSVNMTNRTGASTNSLGFGDSNGTIANGVSYTQSITSSSCIQQMSILQVILAPVSGTTYSQTYTETMTTTGTLTRQVTRPTLETFTLSDSLLHAVQRSLTATFTLTDTFASAFVNLRTLTETLAHTVSGLFQLNGTNVIWSHIAKSAAAAWTHITKSNQ